MSDILARETRELLRKQAERIVELEDSVHHWKSNHDQRVLACEFLKKRLDMPVERLGAYQKMLDLQKELHITEQLLEKQYLVIDAIPECPVHGPRCVPHAVDWVKERL